MQMQINLCLTNSWLDLTPVVGTHPSLSLCYISSFCMRRKCCLCYPRSPALHVMLHIVAYVLDARQLAVLLVSYRPQFGKSRIENS